MRGAVTMDEKHYTPKQAAEFRRRRRGGNIAIFCALLALCVIFFAMTMVKMGQH